MVPSKEVELDKNFVREDDFGLGNQRIVLRPSRHAEAYFGSLGP